MDSDVFVVSANMSRWLHCPYFVLSVNAGERYDIASAELLEQGTEKQGSGRPGLVLARNLVGTGIRGRLNGAAMLGPPGSPFSAAWLQRMRNLTFKGYGYGDVNLQMYECCQWPDRYLKYHPSLVRGTSAMRIAPSTLPRCHVWANDSRAIGRMTKLPNQHHMCSPRMRADEWFAQLSRIASREGTAALHFSGSSSAVRSRVQEHAVLEWALAHAVAQIGGAGALTEQQRTCVDLARAWLESSAAI